jgi:hypothetical protein
MKDEKRKLFIFPDIFSKKIGGEKEMKIKVSKDGKTISGATVTKVGELVRNPYTGLIRSTGTLEGVTDEDGVVEL